MLAYAVIGQIPLLIEIAVRSAGGQAFVSADVKSLSEMIGENRFLIYIIFPFIFTFLAIALATRYLHKRPIKSLFTSRRRIDWKRYFFSFGIWLLFLALLLLVNYFVNDTVYFNAKWSTFIPLLLISLILIPIQSTCEELLFRSYLLQGFQKVFGKPWMSVLITGILFGLMHFSNPEIKALGPQVLVYYIITGVFLALIAVWDNGLELSMGYHAANNVFGALILTNDWQVFQTDALFIDHAKPEFGWDSIVTLLIIQPLLLFIFFRIYRWKNLKEQLVAKDEF